MAKQRVSAKQRLELIKQAVELLEQDNGSTDAYVRFTERVWHALNSKLEPRAKKEVTNE